MRYLVYTICVVFVAISSCNGGADNVGDRQDNELFEWEEMVQRAVNNLRTKRSDVEPEHHIDKIQDHYTTAFRDVHNTAARSSENAYVQDRETYGYGSRYGYAHEQKYGDIQTPVSGRYIVMLQSTVSDTYLDRTISILENANSYGDGRFVAKHISPIRTIGKGFTATLGQSAVEVLMEHPERYSVEQDMALKRHENVDHAEEQSISSSSHVPWNLDRLDQHNQVLNNVYSPMGTGQGVDVYILDTGIRYSHKDLEGRAYYAGYDAIDELTGSTRRGSDCNSHGTHCAGTVGGKTYGVAKKATLYAARVLDCTGSGAVSGIIHTMEFIAKKRKSEDMKNPAVFSMSLGVHKSDAFNAAANSVSAQGILVVAASGNQGEDSCDYSPGSAAQAVSVAASDMTDTAVSFSNLGKCVTVFAPGSRIESASNKCDICTVVKSGTSMACPHAAGLAAIYMSLSPSLTTEQVKKLITTRATSGAINLSGDGAVQQTNDAEYTTPNLLLYVGK